MVDTDVTNCVWPDDDTYIASIYNEESGNPAGTATNDFGDAAVLAGLQANAQEGVNWVWGIDHPTFAGDIYNIPADYAALDKVLETIPDDLSLYTDESAAALQALIEQVDRGLSEAEQDRVDALADAIAKAVSALEEKPAEPDIPETGVGSGLGMGMLLLLLGAGSLTGSVKLAGKIR